MQLVPSVGLEPAASCSQSRRTTDCAMTTYQTSSGLSGSEEVDPSWRWSRWGTYPSPATGYMKERKSRWRRDKRQPPPAAFDGISIACFFGSKRSFFQQPEIFSHLRNQFTIPAQRGLFGNVDRIRRAENGV